MQPADRIHAAAAEVDVLDVAGRIIANPARNAQRVGTGEVLALARATEALNAIAIEAELLVRTLSISTESFTGEEQFALRDHAIQTQADAIVGLLAAMRGEIPAPEKE